MSILKLSTLRKRKGLTQVQLAEKLGLHPLTITKWESGTAHPRWSLIPSLASIFGCAIRDLFTDDKPEVA